VILHPVTAYIMEEGMNGKFKQLFLISMLLGLFISAFAETLTIPDDYSTIQAGLNAADSSDTVYVKAGTYQENIFWPDKNGIKLIGEDSSNTVIDGGGNGSVFNIALEKPKIDTTILIKNFTIQNGGNVKYGGGLFLKNVNLILIELYIKYNKSSDYGCESANFW